MIKKLKEQIRRHPLICGIAFLYLALASIGWARALIFDPPRVLDVGFYDWEVGESSEGDYRFRWTRGEEAHLLRPPTAPVVTVPLLLYRPELPDRPVTIAVGLEDAILGRHSWDRNGRYELSFYLPAILGADRWRCIADSWTEMRAYENIRVPRSVTTAWYGLGPSPRREAMTKLLWSEDQVPDYVRLFERWARPPGPPSIWFHVRVDETFVPFELIGTPDFRKLGVGIGELHWAETVPAEGIGFHSWESDPNGVEFRWTRQRASLPVEIRGDDVVFMVRADHPDIETSPVVLNVFLDAYPLGTVRLEDRGWKQVRFPAESSIGDNRVLSLSVSRTWNPYLWSSASAGSTSTSDTRFLGVAITRISWE